MAALGAGTGWSLGAMHAREAGEVCACYRVFWYVGMSLMMPAVSRRAMALIEDVAAECFPDRMGAHDGIGAFNDHPDTTQADVELVLEKAAIRLDELVEP